MDEMREFMIAAEYLMQPVEKIIVEESISLPEQNIILEDLKDTVFKLRSFTETTEGDMGLGIEFGMQRAADMIENIIKRFTDQENV